MHLSEPNSAPLTIQGLHKSYAAKPVLQGIDLRVNKAAVHGLIGLNGAGKTTLLECMLGLQRFSGGEIALFGHRPEKLYQTAGKLAVVFDSPCLPPQLSVRQLLQYRTIGSETGYSAAELEQLLGIERYSRYKIKQLSLGNKRRVSIAQALIGRPEFIVLDEPFNGLDAGGVEDVLALITRLNHTQGTTFLLASHQLAYLEKICTELSILHDGRLQVSAPMSTLFAHQKGRVSLRVGDIEQARALLQSLPGLSFFAPDPAQQHQDRTLLLESETLSPAQVNHALVSAGIEVHELLRLRPSLHELFHSVTGTDIQ